MGRGEATGCNRAGKCFYNTCRSIPYVPIFATLMYSMGAMLVWKSDGPFIDGVRATGGAAIPDFDVHQYLSYAIVASSVLNAIIIIISACSTGWVLETCCRGGRNAPCYVKCARMIVGQIAHAIIFLFCFVVILVLVSLLALVVFLLAVALIENKACDADAQTAMDTGIYPPYNETTGPPIAAEQTSAGHLFTHLLQFASPEPITLEAGSAFAVGMCCGKEKFGVDTDGIAMGFYAGTAIIDHSCSSIGSCRGVEEVDDAECSLVVPDYVNTFDYPEMVLKKQGADFSIKCYNNPKCYVKAAPSVNFIEGAAGSAIGFGMGMVAQMIMLVHITKKIVMIAYEQKMERGHSKWGGKDEDEMAQPLYQTKIESSGASYTQPGGYPPPGGGYAGPGFQQQPPMPQPGLPQYGYRT